MSFRRFGVYGRPHLADPAWIQPVTEISENEGTVGYTNADELGRVVWKLQYDLGFNSGRNAENVRAHKFLEHIKCSPEQIREFMRFNG